MSNPQTSLVSVIVPTFNDSATLRKCVESLAGQTWVSLEILVINDGSTDSTGQLLGQLESEFPQLRAFHLPFKQGAATARNLGFREARGEILALIDGDMWAPPDWIEQLVAPLLKGEAEVTGGPDYVPATAPLVSRCIGYSMDSVMTNAGLRLGDTRLVNYLPGTGNMAIFSRCLEAAGEFDVRFHDTGEDKEWLYRVRQAGARFLYLPHALAWHERRPDIVLHARKQLLSGRRRFDIWLKDSRTIEFPHLAPGLLILFLTLGALLPPLRSVWLAVVLLGLVLVLLDCARGAYLLKEWRAFPILLATSPVIPLGYGVGLWLGALQRFHRTRGEDE